MVKDGSCRRFSVVVIVVAAAVVAGFFRLGHQDVSLTTQSSASLETSL